MIGTLILYLFVLAVVMILCKPKHGKIDKQRINFALAIMLLLTVCRWDIGNDYANYAKHVQELARDVYNHGLFGAYNYNDGHTEITYIFLSWLFAKFPGSYLWVIGTLGIISQVFIFLSLKRVNGYYWGYFALFMTELIFLSWDAIRQGAAIAIVLYSIGFIKEGNYVKYVLSILAASLFHTSAIVLLPFILLRWVKIHDFILVAAIMVMTVLMWTGFLTNSMAEVTAYFTLFEHYAGYADTMATLAVAESTMYKLRLVLYALFWSGTILLLPKEEMIYKIYITIGGCIFLFAMNSMSITRIAWYFLSAILVGLPLAMQELKKYNKKGKVNIRKVAFASIMAAMVFLFSYDVIRDSNTHGCSPYDSIFSGNYASQKFRPKSY